ncbi:MAG TPA: hypothetical protein VMC09_01865 [Anaerolineales bacterium]|nr:hypothetical protein [Anaerolineales bacterium]
MNTNPQSSISPDTSPESIPSRFRVRFGLAIVLFGFLVFLVGIRPSLFGLDRSPVVGFVQISVFLVGMAIICIGGYVSLVALWKGSTRTIPADIGSRLVATGYVVAVFSGMADVFGFGTQVPPRVPLFGPWQAMGVQIGEALIAIGFLLLIPYPLIKRERQAPTERKAVR